MENSYAMDKVSKTIFDIDHCLGLPRADEKMFWFLHIYQSLDKKIITELKLEELKLKVESLIKVPETKRKIDYYYAVLESEAKIYLLDERQSHKSKGIYNLDSEIYAVPYKKSKKGTEYKSIYNMLLIMELEIAEKFGKIKEKLLTDKRNLLNDFT